MATPVILVTGHEGTAAVTADLLGLLTDHGTATLRSVAPGSVRRADPRPRCHRREQRRRHRASMKSAIHPDHHPRRLPRCPVLRRDQVVLEMIVITMVGRPSGPGERKWDVWGSVARAVTGGHVPVKSILTGAHADPHSYQASPADAAAIVDAELVIYNGGGYDPWVDQVLAGHPGVQAVDAYSLLGAVGDDDAPNEHVFYDPNVAKAVAATIADRLADLDPSNSGNYRARRRRVQPRRRRNRNFRTRDRHHLSRRRGHRDRTRRALPAGGSRPEKSNPGYLHRGQRKRQRPHPGRYGGRARHDRRP